MSERRPSSAAGRRCLVRCVAVAAAAVLTVTGCAPGPVGVSAGHDPTGTTTRAGDVRSTQVDSVATDILAAYQLDSLGAKEIVDRLDRAALADRPTGLMASVRPGTLVLSDKAGRTASLPMPADEFYLSIAPYVEKTHECHFHSLTTCRGELSGAEMQITVRDDATGSEIFKGSRTTYDNGFVGLWLPRHITATLTVDYQGRQAVSAISTGDGEDATCLTTMRLT